MKKTPSLSRRQLLKWGARSAGAGLLTTRPLQVWASGYAPYAGRLLVTLQLDGGADVTQFCDPKTNTPGERKINNWADSLDPIQHGRLSCAPVGDNDRLFRNFYRNTLVINGVDAQTNSHETGRLFNWTGSNAEGNPSLTAMFAAHNSPTQPFAYNVFGGTTRTANLITYNQINSIRELGGLAAPNTQPWDVDRTLRPVGEVERAANHVARTVQQMLADPKMTPRQRASLLRHSDAIEGRAPMQNLLDVLPPDDQLYDWEELMIEGEDWGSNIKQQMQSALLVFKSGLGSAADMQIGGFDSHDNHDPIHNGLLGHVSEAVHFFWEYAEQLGIADRITLVMGSDFGRTNFYNDGNGKDHWPIGSYMVMENNPAWGNRVVGASDELHFARTIDPNSLALSNALDAVTITPTHVHKALRNYLGLDGFAQTEGLGMDNIPLLPLFDPDKYTVT